MNYEQKSIYLIKWDFVYLLYLQYYAKEMQTNSCEFRSLFSANYRRHFPNSQARNEMTRTFANANKKFRPKEITICGECEQILKSRIIFKRLSTHDMFYLSILLIGYHSEDFEHRLIHDLFKSGYSKEALPVRNKSEAIEVMFDMAYSQLIYLVRNYM